MDAILISTAADTYKSTSPEPSYLAQYVLFPLYDWIVTFYPSTWVPNKVTLFGVVCTLVSTALLLTSMPAGSNFVPPLADIRPVTMLVSDPYSVVDTPLYPTVLQPVFSSIFSVKALLITCGLLNLIYCIADNTDGRLARRLKKSSANGEYLDHGLDCFTSLLSTAVTMSVDGVGLSNSCITLLAVAFVTMLSHTLHYETNTFIWGNRFATVDEAMLFFGLGQCVPLLLPNMVSTRVPPELLRTVLPARILLMLRGVRWLDVAYTIYVCCQFQVIFNIARKRIQMLFRFHTMVMCGNMAVLALLIPAHAAVMEASQSTTVPGYTLGPLSYPAVWIITAAATCSMIVHVVIYARCLRLPYVELAPLAALFPVWSLFICCPVGGMVLSVLFHLLQVEWNLRSFRVGKVKTA